MKPTFDPVENPPVSFYFSVQVGTDEKESSFREVSGISYEIQTEDISEGGNPIPYKVPKSINYPNLILKKGMLSASELRNWCEQTINKDSLDFRIEKKDIIVKLLDPSQGPSKPLVSWLFTGAYPIKYEVSSFNAESNEIVVESIELVYRRFSREQ